MAPTTLSIITITLEHATFSRAQTQPQPLRYWALLMPIRINGSKTFLREPTPIRWRSTPSITRYLCRSRIRIRSAEPFPDAFRCSRMPAEETDGKKFVNNLELNGE